MPRDPGLGRLQRWLQAVILHPGSDHEAVASQAAKAEVASVPVERIVRPSRTLTSVERIGVYRGMYVARLREALEFDYPALRCFLGESSFDRLVEGYVRANPSVSYTLNRLGDRLPEYIRSLRGIPRRALLYDLAAFELAMTEVFDEEEVESLTPETIRNIPPQTWPSIRLTPIPAFRLLSLKYPVHEFHQAMKDNSPRPPARMRKTQLVVFRRDYAVRRVVLTPAAYEILRGICSGESLGDALSGTITRRRSISPDSLREWFREWVSEGLFRSISHD